MTLDERNFSLLCSCGSTRLVVLLFLFCCYVFVVNQSVQLQCNKITIQT